MERRVSTSRSFDWTQVSKHFTCERDQSLLEYRHSNECTAGLGNGAEEIFTIKCLFQSIAIKMPRQVALQDYITDEEKGNRTSICSQRAAWMSTGRVSFTVHRIMFPRRDAKWCLFTGMNRVKCCCQREVLSVRPEPPGRAASRHTTPIHLTCFPTQYHILVENYVGLRSNMSRRPHRLLHKTPVSRR